MYLPDTERCNVSPNSTSPISASRIAAGQARLTRINRVSATAQRAVLGFCSDPNSYREFGVNLQSDVAQSPPVMQKIASGQFSSSTVAASGNGGITTGPDVTPEAPQVVPMNGSGNAVPDWPVVPPQTTPQGMNVPRLPVGSNVPKSMLPVSVCTVPPDRRALQTTSAAPSWGNAFLQAQPGSGWMQWVESHPLLAAVVLLGGVALLHKGNR
jgi:hypothetical protein